MARIMTSGFETGVAAKGDDKGAFGTAFSIQGTTKRSGSYALKILPATSWGFVRIPAVTGGVNKVAYYRVYLLIHTSLGATSPIMGQPLGPHLRLTTTDKIQLYYNGTQIGVDSAALTKDKWYQIEWSYAYSTGAMELKIEGTSVTTGTGTTSYGATVCDLGVGLDSVNVASGEVYFDDYGQNDNSGSYQNSWCGSGYVMMLSPNAAGDANSWEKNSGAAGDSNNYTLVDEKSADTTDFIRSTTVNQEDMYNVEACGLNLRDKINVVHIGFSWSDSSASTDSPAFRFQCKKTSGGTISQSPFYGDYWETSPHYNGSNIGGNYYEFTLHNDPDGTPWTQATIDTMQIGAKVTNDYGTAYDKIYNMWVMIDYMPATEQTVQAKARIKVVDNDKTVSAKSRIKVIGNDKTIQSKARMKVLGNDKTVQTKARIKQIGVSQTVQARSRIKQIGMTDTIQARARMKVLGNDKTVSAKSDIKQLGVERTISSKGRIKIIDITKTISALSRIKRAGETATVSAKAAIHNVVTWTVSAKVNIIARPSDHPIGTISDIAAPMAAMKKVGIEAKITTIKPTI